jgi:hypothetical protein
MLWRDPGKQAANGTKTAVARAGNAPRRAVNRNPAQRGRTTRFVLVADCDLCEELLHDYIEAGNNAVDFQRQLATAKTTAEKDFAAIRLQNAREFRRLTRRDLTPQRPERAPGSVMLVVFQSMTPLVLS